MRREPVSSLSRQTWWWVFGLFIATPAVVLALLGLRSIHADDIERQQRLRDQQTQTARLADAALSSALSVERLTADGPSRATAALAIARLPGRQSGWHAGWRLTDT